MTSIQKINVILASRGISGAEMAEKIGVSRQSITYWNQSKRSISRENLRKIAEYLSVDIDKLSDDNSELSFMTPLTEQEQTIIIAYRAMDEKKKAEFTEYGLKLAMSETLLSLANN